MGSWSNKEKRQEVRFTVYFDGYCKLCNRWVDRILRNEKGARFHFAPLSSEHAEREVPEEMRSMRKDPEAMILQKGEKFWSGSEAALKIFRYMRWPYRALSWARFLPKSFNEKIYRWVARNRYRWFGKREQCRIPSPSEAERFYER